MLMDPMDDCKISHLEVHCLGQILCEVDLLKAIELRKKKFRGVGVLAAFRKFYCLRQGTWKRH